MRRKSRKFVSSSAGLVDRVREMVEQCREDREETMMGKETKYVVKTDEVETFAFNKACCGQKGEEGGQEDREETMVGKETKYEVKTDDVDRLE